MVGNLWSYLIINGFYGEEKMPYFSLVFFNHFEVLAEAGIDILLVITSLQVKLFCV